MNKFLFIPLAGHHREYFSKIIQNPNINGKVLGPEEWPRPSLSTVLKRSKCIYQEVDWKRLIDEKSLQRKIKGKYHGLLYRMLLAVELYWFALKIYVLIEREKPNSIAFWNGAHRYNQMIRVLAKSGTTFFFFENGLLPNTTTLDPKGVNYNNSVPRHPDFYKNYTSGKPIEDCPVKLVPRKPAEEGKEPISLPDRYVFIPFQDDRDTQIRFFSPWIRNMRELFSLGEKIYKETGLPVIFKEHPSSKSSYPEEHQRTHDNVFFANQNNTQKLIEGSLFVVTVNSTVGLESVLLNKPVVTLGQAFFNIDGVVEHAESADELVKKVSEFPNWGLDHDIQKNFLAYLRNDYCIPGSWKDCDNEHLRSVAARLLDI